MNRFWLNELTKKEKHQVYFGLPAFALYLLTRCFPELLLSCYRFHFPTENLFSFYRFPLLNYESKIHYTTICFQIIKASVLHRFRT